MMIRKDITDENIPNKLKLFAYRVDDSEEEAYSKYEDAHLSGGEVAPDDSSLIRRDPSYNTPDRKGGDGAYFNGLIEVREGIVGFTVGKAFPDAPNTPGGDSNVAIVGQGNSVLPGGGTANTLDFGGRGGSFVYDYYQRICYDDTRPDDGHLSACSHYVKRYKGKKNKSSTHTVKFVIPGTYPAKCLYPPYKPFSLIPFLVQCVVIFPRMYSILLRWYYWFES